MPTIVTARVEHAASLCAYYEVLELPGAFRRATMDDDVKEGVRARLERLEAQEGSVLIVVIEGEQIVGAVDCEAGDFGTELTLTVHQDWRGRGLGGALLAAATAWADARACTLRLQVLVDNPVAMALYGAHEFEPVGAPRLLARPEGREVHDQTMVRQARRGSSTR